jgi:hypothetical protein
MARLALYNMWKLQIRLLWDGIMRENVSRVRVGGWSLTFR